MTADELRQRLEETQEQLNEAKRTIARFENARYIANLELAQLRLALGSRLNTHPAHLSDLLRAIADAVAGK